MRKFCSRVIAESSAGGGAARLFATFNTGDWATRAAGAKQVAAMRSLVNRIIIYLFCEGGGPAAATGVGLPVLVLAPVVTVELLAGLVVVPLVPFGPGLALGWP